MIALVGFPDGRHDIHTSAMSFILGEALVLVGEPPSWLTSLASEKLRRRSSVLPLPFLWLNLTPLRPLPILNGCPYTSRPG